MAGQVSIPVKNRSGRAFAVAAFVALLLAVSQWMHWMGLTNGDLLSFIPGFANATGLQANTYPNDKGFNCANNSLGAEAALMSDELLKTVGQELCSNDKLQVQPQALRGTDNFYVEQQSFRKRTKEKSGLRLFTRERSLIAEPPPRSLLVASIEPSRIDTNRDLQDAIEDRVRKLDAIKPRDDIEHPRPLDDGRDDSRDDHEFEVGDNDNSGHGSGDDRDDDDNSGSGSDGDDNDDDNDNSGHGSDGDDGVDNSGHGSGNDDDDDNNSGSGSGDHDGDDSGSGSGGDREDDNDDDNDGNSGSNSGKSGSGHS